MLLFGRIISSVASQSNVPETACKQPLKDVLAQTSSLHLNLLYVEISNVTKHTETSNRYGFSNEETYGWDE